MEVALELNSKTKKIFTGMDYSKKNLLWIRTKAGLSREKFGELFKYSGPNIQSYEREDVGGSLPPPDLVLQVCQKYGLIMEDFYTVDFSAPKENVSQLAEDPATYGINWKNKYLQILERYTALLEEHTKVLKSK